MKVRRKSARNAAGKPTCPVADRRGFYAREHYEKLGPEWGKAVDAIIRTEGFYRNLDPVDGALARAASAAS